MAAGWPAAAVVTITRCGTGPDPHETVLTGGYRHNRDHRADLLRVEFRERHPFCVSVGIPRVIAWLVSPAVDLSVTGLLLGINVLVQRRSASGEGSGVRLWKLRLMLCFFGLLTLALNTADPAVHHRLGAALVSAVLPVLLLGWSEVDPSLLHQLCALAEAAPPGPAGQGADRAAMKVKDDLRPTSAVPRAVPVGLVALARSLDAEHRQANRGRPISRDALKSKLGCSRDRASAIVKILRAKAQAAFGISHAATQHDGSADVSLAAA
jgi:hypothetical protein